MADNDSSIPLSTSNEKAATRFKHKAITLLVPRKRITIFGFVAIFLLTTPLTGFVVGLLLGWQLMRISTGSRESQQVSKWGASVDHSVSVGEWISNNILTENIEKNLRLDSSGCGWVSSSINFYHYTCMFYMYVRM